MTVEFFVFYQVKSYHIPAEQIELELNGIESNLAQLEKEGVELEKQLRGCEEGTLPLPLTRTPLFFFLVSVVKIKLNKQLVHPAAEDVFSCLAMNNLDTNLFVQTAESPQLLPREHLWCGVMS